MTLSKNKHRSLTQRSHNAPFPNSRLLPQNHSHHFEAVPHFLRDQNLGCISLESNHWDISALHTLRSLHFQLSKLFRKRTALSFCHPDVGFAILPLLLPPKSSQEIPPKPRNLGASSGASGRVPPTQPTTCIAVYGEVKTMAGNT